LLAFAKAAEQKAQDRKLRFKNGGEERRKNQKVREDNNVL